MTSAELKALVCSTDDSSWQRVLGEFPDLDLADLFDALDAAVSQVDLCRLPKSEILRYLGQLGDLAERLLTLPSFCGSAGAVCAGQPGADVIGPRVTSALEMLTQRLIAGGALTGNDLYAATYALWSQHAYPGIEGGVYAGTILKSIEVLFQLREDHLELALLGVLDESTGAQWDGSILELLERRYRGTPGQSITWALAQKLIVRLGGAVA